MRREERRGGEIQKKEKIKENEREKFSKRNENKQKK